MVVIAQSNGRTAESLLKEEGDFVKGVDQPFRNLLQRDTAASQTGYHNCPGRKPVSAPRIPLFGLKFQPGGFSSPVHPAASWR